MTKRRLPIGLQTFRELREEGYSKRAPSRTSAAVTSTSTRILAPLPPMRRGRPDRGRCCMAPRASRAYRFNR